MAWVHEGLAPGALMLFPALVPWAYVFALLPSLASAVVLELAFGLGLDPRRGWTMVLAALLGLASGVAISWPALPNDLEKPVAFGALGAWAGGLVGAMIVWRSRKGAERARATAPVESAPSGEGRTAPRTQG